MTATTLLLLALGHMAGDYVLQSSWMATEKTQRWAPALAHAAVYTACYLPATRSVLALVVIGGTHAVIDRYRLARYLVWAKDHLGPRRTWHPWRDCTATGYAPDIPPWLAVWLMIACDNTVHLAINAASVVWL
jgi:hypothetical protein